jgi:membrane protease YdiL (CAAX protease family)
METPLGWRDHLFIAWMLATALAGVWYLTRGLAHPSDDHPRPFFSTTGPNWIGQLVSFVATPAPVIVFFVCMGGAGMLMAAKGGLFGTGILVQGAASLIGQGLSALTLIALTVAAPGAVQWAPSAHTPDTAPPVPPADGLDEIRLAGRAFRASTCLQAYLAIIALAIASSLLWKGFYVMCASQGQTLPDEPQQVVQMVANFDWSGPWLPILVFGTAITIGAPIAEELTFRGMLYPLLKGWLPRGYAIVITGIVFASIHGSLSAFLPLAAFGAVQCIFRDRYGLFTCIGIHMLFNMVTFFWLNFAPNAATQF